MKTNTRKSAGFTLVELLVVIAIIVTLAGVATPVLIGQKKKGDLAKAVQNAKQIGIAMFDFENDFASFPDDDTETDITDDDDTAILSTAGGSNAYFSQLIAAGYADQETPFFCKTSFSQEPDNDMSAASEMLKAGEVGFSYVMRSSGQGLNTSVNSAIPLIAAPSLDGSSGTFDRNVYNKKAVVLKIDMSVTTPGINSSNEVIIRGQDGLLEGPVWDESNITSPSLEEPDAGSSSDT